MVCSFLIESCNCRSKFGDNLGYANCIKHFRKCGQIEQEYFLKTENQAFSTRIKKIFVKMWHSK